MSDRFSHGLVIGRFYPLHAGHSHLIRTALCRCDRVTVEILGASSETVPLSVRVDWMRQEHPGARVVAAVDDSPVDYESDAAWLAHLRVIESLLDAPVDAVFSSDAYGQELAARLNADWVQVDPGRRQNPVSGTAIRADVAGHWWALSPAVRVALTPRVVVLGAESTGSTTLAKALAQCYATEWVPEYGREYTEIRAGGRGAPWAAHEFDLVADRQIEAESAAARCAPRPLLICDTDVLATAIWHEHYIGSRSSILEARAASHRPALYLLTGDEIPFVQDDMRDGEQVRHGMQQRFRDTLAAQDVPWIEVRGTVGERVSLASAVIDRMLTARSPFGPSNAPRGDARTEGAQSAG